MKSKLAELGATIYGEIKVFKMSTILSIYKKHIASPFEWNVEIHVFRNPLYTKQYVTRLWANAQRDGRPAEYRWRPLFDAAEFD